MKKYKLNVKSRDGIGRGPARRLRNAGLIPGIIYGKGENLPISIDAVEFRTLMRAKGTSAALVELAIEGGAGKLSIIKDYQRNALSQKIVHIDILEVDPNVEMTTVIPVRTKGDAVGVLSENGTLEVVSSITVRCLPKDLPEFIEVDVSDLHVGHSIHIGALPPIPGVTFPSNQNPTIAVCIEPEEVPAETEAAPAAEGDAAAAAPADASAAAPAAAAPAKGAPAKK